MTASIGCRRAPLEADDKRMQNYRNLVAWRRAHALVIAGYAVARALPREERFELTSQLRRALVSITSNIAEGAGRDGDRAFAAALSVASGSAAEVENLLLVARDVGYLTCEAHEPLDAAIVDVRKLIYRLRSAVVTRSQFRRH